MYIISCQCPTRHLAQAFNHVVPFRAVSSTRAIRRGTPSSPRKRATLAVLRLAPGWSRSQAGGGGCIGLLCLLRCIVCLLGLLLCACFRLSLPLLGSFIIWLKAPCFGSFVVPAGGTALPLGLGDLNNLFLLVGLGLFILSRNSVSNPFAGYQP